MRVIVRPRRIATGSAATSIRSRAAKARLRTVPKRTAKREPSAARKAASASRNEGRGGYRPNGGQPNGNFNGRPRRPGGGPRRAQG